MVTFYYPSDAEDWKVDPLFYPPETKDKFHVDARRIRLGTPLNEGTVLNIAYFYGLWSHTRIDWFWKGFVHVALDPEQDDLARRLLEHELRNMEPT